MVLPKRNAVLTQEERIKRLKESRQKYSQMSKQKIANQNGEQSSSAAPAPRPAVVPKPMAPRPSFAPRPSLAPRSSIAPRPQTSTKSRDEADFEVDPNSLAMIKSGKITMPTGRPSISGARHTIGSRQSLAGRPISRFRASIAQEPRPSLLPLGINVFEASANQRNEVSDFLSSFIPTNTPAKPSTSMLTPSGNVFSGMMASTRSKKIRFMETVIQEVRESAESAEVAAASTSVRHSPISDTSFMPTSILSTKKNIRKKVNLNGGPAATPRKVINFDDDESAEEPEKENIGKEVEGLERIVETLANPNIEMNKSDEKRVREALKKLQKSLDLRSEQDQTKHVQIHSINFKTPLKRVLSTAPVPVTPLGSILESINLEESPEGEEADLSERRKKKLRRSSKMKVGGDVTRQAHQRRSSRAAVKFMPE